ncbi:oligosaccharide flippase family protein [Acinetobacter ihumii]|uniref:oligosaccharide flippase family protein n=1 Tax=Acinetobacter ihumii TaxID=2483802 RepID=UPI00102F9386|nr:oligosaccharide flippase family protein [Acinetobacter ihumii]
MKLKILKSRILRNSVWSFSEKVISIFGLIFVTSLVAKYIGAENFGKLNYAISLFGIIQTIAWMGCENIIFQRTSKNAISGWYLIKLTRTIRDTAFFLTAIPLLLYFYYFTDQYTFYFGVAASVSAYIASHDLYTIYFNAQLKSKINTICNLIGLTISLLIRFLIVKLNTHILWLCVPIILVALIPFIIKFYIFNYGYRGNLYRYKKITYKYRKYLLKNGSKLLLYTLSIAIFTRTSQFFIGTFVDMRSVGIFTVAYTVGGGISLLLNSFISSLMVNVFSEKKDLAAESIVLKTYYLVFTLCILFFIFMFVFGEIIILFLYGEEYIESVRYLYIFIFSALFSSISNISEKYIMRYRGYHYLFKKTLILLLINILLTFMLVKYYGLIGAALAVLITEVLAATVLNYFFRNGLLLKLHFFKLFKIL